ncbi:MAG: response regulator, partial [Alphaproteobacteria bacterium]
ILNLYKNSLDSHGKSSFDAIITDINMDLLNGDEASSEIRIIEEANNVEFYNKIPIIAITGDGSQESVHNYFKNGINDYFVKGKNFQILIKILANNFINIDIDKDYMDNSVNNLKVPEININSNNIFNTNFISNFSNEEKIKILNLFIDDSKQIISKIKKYNSIGN